MGIILFLKQGFEKMRGGNYHVVLIYIAVINDKVEHMPPLFVCKLCFLQFSFQGPI